MSDEDKEVDVESGDEEENDEGQPKTFANLAEKRAHHNALERKRRDHIKDSFCGLRDCIPSLEGEKSSRAQILHKATEHIQYMRRKNHSHQADIDELKRHNMILDQQVRQLEKARSTGTLTLDPATAALLNPDLLLQPSHPENVIGVQGEQIQVVQAATTTDPLVKNETTVIRPNNVTDHDDYTIAPKRMKPEPP